MKTIGYPLNDHKFQFIAEIPALVAQYWLSQLGVDTLPAKTAIETTTLDIPSFGYLWLYHHELDDWSILRELII